MKIKIGAFVIAILSIIIMQSTVIDYIKIFGVKPNLLLIITVCVGFLGGSLEGAIVGLTTGFCHDIVSGKFLGLYALLGLYAGLITGSINRRLYRENLIILTFFTFICTIVYELLLYLLYKWGWYLAGSNTNIEVISALKNVILPEAVYNSVLSIPIFLITLKLYRIFDEKSALKRTL